MRRIVLLVMLAACSGPAKPATPLANASTAGPVTGDVRLRLGGDYPDFAFGGSEVIADGSEHRITVPASDDELTRIEIEGWRPIWVRVPVGGSTTLSTHPCCGITFDSNSYDDAIATCAPDGGACPIERDELHPAIAADALCGERERCVPRRKLRVVQARVGGAESIVDEDGEVFRAGEAEDLVFANIADMYTFDVGGVRQDVAMDRATTYTIFLDGDQVTRVRATRW
jgi:hypothetical protein